MHILPFPCILLPEDTLNTQCKCKSATEHSLASMYDTLTSTLVQHPATDCPHDSMNLAETLTYTFLHLHCPQLKYDHRLTMKPLLHFKALFCRATQDRQHLTDSYSDNVSITFFKEKLRGHKYMF